MPMLFETCRSYSLLPTRSSLRPTEIASNFSAMYPVYVAGAKLLTKLGSADLAAVAADRAAMTAGVTDSLIAQGMATYQEGYSASVVTI